MTELFLENTMDGVRAALTKDGVLFRYEEEKEDAAAAEGIYLARVDRCMPALEAAFVKIGPDKAAYLPYREMRGIRIPPRSGEEILVQVKKGPVDQKQPYVTMDIALAGRGAVFLPLSDKRSISASVTDESARAELAERCARLCPGEGGLILRREAQNMDDAALGEEIGSLRERWRDINAPGRSGIGLIAARERVWQRFLRDARPRVDRVVADFEVPGVQAVYSENPFGIYGVEEQKRKALQRVHHLNCGGNVTLEKTEALWVADVNSARAVDQKKGIEKTALKVNCEAAREIARLCQVRNVGGILVVDFVDMDLEASREQVREALREAFASDPRKVDLVGFTALGLFEITRKKDGSALL